MLTTRDHVESQPCTLSTVLTDTFTCVRSLAHFPSLALPPSRLPADHRQGVIIWVAAIEPR